MSDITKDFKYCNHHHNPTENHKVVTIGGSTFVANKMAIPLLTELSNLGLRTRTHHIDEEGGFFSLIIDDSLSFEVRKVSEPYSTRDDFEGETELLIRWRKP